MGNSEAVGCFKEDCPIAVVTLSIWCTKAVNSIMDKDALWSGPGKF